jgi:hypothetical protein
MTYSFNDSLDFTFYKFVAANRPILVILPVCRKRYVTIKWSYGSPVWSAFDGKRIKIHQGAGYDSPLLFVGCACKL